MISGEFDLSVGSILGVVAMFFMAAMTTGDPIFGIIMDPLPAAIYAIFIGAIMGFINGFILVTTRIPSFIVTLGTLLAYRAISLVAIAGGRILRYRDHYAEFPQVFISPWVFVVMALIGLVLLLYAAYRIIPSVWRNLVHSWTVRADNGDFGTTSALVNGVIAFILTIVMLIVGVWLVMVAMFHLGADTVQVGFFDIMNGRWDGSFLMSQDSFFYLLVPSDSNFRMAILWWLIFVIFFHVILTNTAYGNSVFAVGGNVGAARAQGINVPYIKVFNFVLVATLTAVAAIYETARNPGVDPLKGDGWELEVIAMTVIGGALLSGGYGSIIGSLLGALIFGMLQTGLVLVGIESRLFSGTIGVVIIIAVVLNTSVRGRQGN
jgi:ribose/xylose/arabinose/galactoside ABC-type transport system permease subunit